jgi:hypothetical protein
MPMHNHKRHLGKNQATGTNTSNIPDQTKEGRLDSCWKIVTPIKKPKAAIRMFRHFQKKVIMECLLSLK